MTFAAKGPHCTRPSLQIGLTAHDPTCKWPSLHMIPTADGAVLAHNIVHLLAAHAFTTSKSRVIMSPEV